MKPGAATPWGPAQHVEDVGRGVVFASTAGHGGYFVPAGLLARIPKAEREYARSWSGSERWYEEDCCALSVVLAFPELFPDVTAAQRVDYRATLDRYMQPEPPKVAAPRLAVAAGYEPPAFNEADCGGAFDGFTVTSDADPGL